MTIHVTPIPSTIELTTPAFSLGTTNTAGASVSAVSSNSTLLAFDTTDPAAVGVTASVGSATVASRRDHGHAGTPNAGTTVDDNLARYSGTSGALQGYTSGGPVASDTGQLTLPGNPVVSVTLGSTVSNVTGDGTEYTIPFANEIIDRTSNYANPTFTAPVTGQYLISATYVATGIDSSNTSSYIKFVTSNRDYQWWVNPYNIYDTNIGTVLEFDAQCDMDASDTLTVTAAIYGGAKVSDLHTASSLQVTLLG